MFLVCSPYDPRLQGGGVCASRSEVSIGGTTITGTVGKKSTSIRRRPSNTPGLSEKPGAISVRMDATRPETASTQGGRGARGPKGCLKRCGGNFRDQRPTSANAFPSVVPSFLHVRQRYSHVSDVDGGVRSCFWVPGIIGLYNMAGIHHQYSGCTTPPIF